METWGGTTGLTAGAYIETIPQEVLMSLGAIVDGQSVWSGYRMRPDVGGFTRYTAVSLCSRRAHMAFVYDIDKVLHSSVK